MVGEIISAKREVLTGPIAKHSVGEWALKNF